MGDIRGRNGMTIQSNGYSVTAPKGICLMHGANPKHIGLSRWDMRDANGKPFIQELLKVTKTKGFGWVDYKYLNPITDNVEPKSTYGEVFKDLLICCGVYTP